MLLELHCHTWYSRGTRIPWEGLDSPKNMAKQALKMGVEGLAITDHNHLTKLKSKDLLIIPGIEVSADDHGKEKHVIGLGVQEEIPMKLSVEETIDSIHDQGGIAVACHPFDIYGKGIRSKSDLCDAIEVFSPLNLERISNWKAKRFAKKNKMPTVTGSDAHCLEMLGHGLTYVPYGMTDVDEVLKAIRKGNTKLFTRYYPIPTLVDWYTLRLRLSYFDVLKFLDSKGRFRGATGKKLLKLVRKSPGRIDYLFRTIAYLGLGGAFVYGGVRTLLP